MTSRVWDKVESNLLESAKINKLRKLPGGDACVIIFMKMLLHARIDGFVCDGANYRCFVDEIGEEYEIFIMAVAILRELCLISLDENEDVYISNTVIHAEDAQALFKQV